MTEPKSSNLSGNEKLSRNLANQVQQLDLKMFWYLEFMSKSRKQSRNDGTQVQQLECEWEIVKKFTKPSPATWFEIVLIYGVQVEKPKTQSKWRNPIPATRVWMKNCQEIYRTKSINLIWNCFDIWNSCRKAENRVQMKKPKSSNLSVNEKLSRNLPNQVQQLDLKLFWYMEFKSKSQKQSWTDGTQVQQLECEWEIVKKFTKPSPATWVWMRNCQEIYQTNSSNLIWKYFDIWNSCKKAENKVKMTEPKSSNLSVNKKFSRKLPIQVQQLECERKIVKKFTEPSPGTWFEIVLIYGVQVEKPKTQSKWRNPIPATRVWMKNCQEIYRTKSINLIWNCFDIWNSCRKAENRVQMKKPKSSNLSVNEKLSRNLPNQVQQLDLKLFWYMEFKSKSQKQSWTDGTQVQQLECEWEIVKKFTKPSPATWVWMRNCQEIYQTNSSNLIWKYFDIWNSCKKAENKVKMTEPKSSNLSVNKKFSRKLPIQVQKLDLKLFWYIGFRSTSQKQSWNDGTQVQQLEWEWKIVKKFSKPSPATWFENVLIFGIHVEKPKTE